MDVDVPKVIKSANGNLKKKKPRYLSYKKRGLGGLVLLSDANV